MRNKLGLSTLRNSIKALRYNYKAHLYSSEKDSFWKSSWHEQIAQINILQHKYEQYYLNIHNDYQMLISDFSASAHFSKPNQANCAKPVEN